MQEIYLGLGSNVGDRYENLSQAIQFIEEVLGKIDVLSEIIETPAWGPIEQQSFLNQVCRISSDSSAFQLIEKINIYQKSCRSSDYVKWGPRSIDIDVLYYGSNCIFAEDLEIPHPQISVRKFVLYSLAEISPDFIHPIEKKTQKALLEACEDKSQVTVASNAQI